jgi:hypothetical protein
MYMYEQSFHVTFEFSLLRVSFFNCCCYTNFCCPFSLLNPATFLSLGTYDVTNHNLLTLLFSIFLLSSMCLYCHQPQFIHYFILSSFSVRGAMAVKHSLCWDAEMWRRNVTTPEAILVTGCDARNSTLLQWYVQQWKITNMHVHIIFVSVILRRYIVYASVFFKSPCLYA